MFTTILGFLAFFVGVVFAGWVLTLIRVRLGLIKRGQQAREEYFDSIGFAFFMTVFIFLLGLENLMG